MPTAMPQEIEVWYLIPALRKELAKVFVDKHHLSQKDAAQILGITESAISQYRKAKRGTELKFTKDELAQIAKAAEIILHDKARATKHLYDLCVEFRGSRTVCELHKKHNIGLPKQCRICIQE